MARTVRQQREWRFLWALDCNVVCVCGLQGGENVLRMAMLNSPTLR